MKNLLIIIFLALLLLSVGYIIQRPTESKQKPKQSSLNELDEPENWKPENDDCLHRNRYTLTKRLSMYPFNKAAKVLAVSYYDAWDEEADITYDTPDTASKKAETENEIVDHGIRIVNGVLDTSHLVDIKKLNAAQIDRLTYLLYKHRLQKRRL